MKWRLTCLDTNDEEVFTHEELQTLWAILHGAIKEDDHIFEMGAGPACEKLYDVLHAAMDSKLDAEVKR